MRSLFAQRRSKRPTRDRSAASQLDAASLGISPTWYVDRKAIIIGAQLGSGAFSSVHKCNVAGWAEACVAKRVLPHKLKPADADMLRHEIALWTLLVHANTVKLLGLSAEPQECCLLCEFCEDGTLELALEKARAGGAQVAEVDVLEQMHQIASGVEHVHSLGFMHRDLKPANILVHGAALKVGDFGLACSKPEHKCNLTAETGSYRWMAPEVMRHEPYNELCDVYSYALIAWQLYTLEPPFESLLPVQAAFAVADQDARPQVPPSASAALSALLRACWHKTLEYRPPFVDVLRTIESLRHAACAPLLTGGALGAVECNSAPNTPLTVALSRSDTPIQMDGAAPSSAAAWPAHHHASSCSSAFDGASPARDSAAALSSALGVRELPADCTDAEAHADGAHAERAASSPVAHGQPSATVERLPSSLFDLDTRADIPRRARGSRSPSPASSDSERVHVSHDLGAGRDLFGTDPASPKSERKRVLLHHDDFALEFNDAKMGTNPLHGGAAPPSHIEPSGAVIHRELSISTGLKTLLTVQMPAADA